MIIRQFVPRVMPRADRPAVVIWSDKRPICGCRELTPDAGAIQQSRQWITNSHLARSWHPVDGPPGEATPAGPSRAEWLMGF
jgi:hypothetical protein